MNLTLRSFLVSALAATMALTLSACGSSAPSSMTRTTCASVAAVLSDGPDPGADPVGYAEAQIVPLRQIHTSDAALKKAIDGLSGAYRQFYTTNGSSSAKLVLKNASAAVNHICPGVVS